MAAPKGRNLIPTLPARLRELRTRLDISQAALADRAGVHVNQVALIERGERSPSLDVAGRIADALGVLVDCLRDEPGKKIRKKISD